MTTPAHPLETVFDMEPGSFKFDDTSKEVSTAELVEKGSMITDPTTGEMIERSSQPDLGELEKEDRIEDLHIEVRLEQIREAAFDAFEQQSRLAQEVEPRLSARNAEVAAQYLNIALNSVNSRVDAKYKRQKIRIATKSAGTPGTVNNNVIVADRNALLKELLGTPTQMVEEVKDK